MIAQSCDAQEDPMNQIIPRAKGWLLRSYIHYKLADLRKADSHVTIISQNCIGGVFYHDMEKPFLSPTVNTFIPEPDFLRMVLNLQDYMAQKLEVHWSGEYPIGTLGDIKIHFVHYHTCEEAEESWNRRTARINYEKILVLCTDRDTFDDHVYSLWKQVPYPKVLFTANDCYTEDAVYFPEYSHLGCIADLIPGRKFYRNGSLQRVFRSML